MGDVNQDGADLNAGLQPGPANPAADELAANVQQLAINGSSKTVSSAMVYKGKPDDPPKQFFIKHWEVVFLSANLDKDKWAITAAGKLAPEILLLLLGDALPALQQALL